MDRKAELEKIIRDAHEELDKIRDAERDAKLGAAVRGATLDIFGDAKNAYNELAAEAAGCFFATDIDGEPTDEPSDSGWSRWIMRVAEAIIQQHALDAEAVPPAVEPTGDKSLPVEQPKPNGCYKVVP